MPDSAALWTVARQAPLSMGLRRQEYWSGLPIPSPWDPPIPGIEPTFPTLADRLLTSEPPGMTHLTCMNLIHTNRFHTQKAVLHHYCHTDRAEKGTEKPRHQ